MDADRSILSKLRVLCRPAGLGIIGWGFTGLTSGLVSGIAARLETSGASLRRADEGVCPQVIRAGVGAADG